MTPLGTVQAPAFKTPLGTVQDPAFRTALNSKGSPQIWLRLEWYRTPTPPSEKATGSTGSTRLVRIVLLFCLKESMHTVPVVDKADFYFASLKLPKMCFFNYLAITQPIAICKSQNAFLRRICFALTHTGTSYGIPTRVYMVGKHGLSVS